MTLYDNYKSSYKLWESNAAARARGLTSPVFIVVCNNTNVSRMVFEYIAGWEKTIDNGIRVQAGKLDLFANDDGDGKWRDRPYTILVDSLQLESGGAMSPEFKAVAAREIDEFKSNYVRRFPGRDVDEISDEDLLREVMNTVGKAGTLGEHVRCVVSVSMLTEGWDANTVTHILGVRAFGTQLLCEQVVGRALRRMSYAANDEGKFEPEYAEVYGVPFSFIPSSGSSGTIEPGPIPTRVRALSQRIGAEITFPRLNGYRFEIPDGPLEAVFSEESQMAISTFDNPTQTQVASIIGEQTMHGMYDLERERRSKVAFSLARLVYESKLSVTEGEMKPWLFPQVLTITKRWMDECVTLKDDTFIQMLLLTQHAYEAAEKIYRAIVNANTNMGTGTPHLLPMLRPYDTIGSTQYVDFDTSKPVYVTREDKCHVSHVVADTGSWEQKMAQTLEDMSEVVRYVKNANLGFTIPYTLDGVQREYIPDFIVCIDDGRGPSDLLNLLVEVTGENKRDKKAKTATTRDLWIPAVNNHGGFGRWSFIEITDPWNAASDIRGHVAQESLVTA